jgi:hypothetical protein
MRSGYSNLFSHSLALSSRECQTYSSLFFLSAVFQLQTLCSKHDTDQSRALCPCCWQQHVLM